MKFNHRYKNYAEKTKTIGDFSAKLNQIMNENPRNQYRIFFLASP